MNPVVDAANKLMENFSEMEADMEEAVYKALSPHVYEMVKGLAGINKESERITGLSRFIKVLLSCDRLHIPDSTIKELAALIESGQSFNLIRLAFNLEGAPQQEVPRVINVRGAGNGILRRPAGGHPMAGLTETRLRELRALTGLNMATILDYFTVHPVNTISLERALEILREHEDLDGE